MGNIPLRYERSAVELAVCGLHMRGFTLEKQLLAHGAVFLREDATAPVYRLYALPGTPEKPGLVRVRGGGVSAALEIWRIPTEALGSFAALIPAPLGLGKVLLQSGRETEGFLCEAFAAETAADISAYGGWRRYDAARRK